MCGQSRFEEPKTKPSLQLWLLTTTMQASPATANSFTRMVRLKEAAWDELKQKNIVTSVYFSRIESKANFAIWHAPISQDVL